MPLSGSHDGPARQDDRGAISFPHPWAFWTGVVACTAGVLLHLPMYWSTRDMHFVMKGMTPDAPMITGMVLIGVGLVLSAYGLVPRNAGEVARRSANVRVAALDEAGLKPQHVILLLVMSLAVTIDIMKPITLSFVAPGTAKEYGLKSPGNPHGHIPVSLLALVGIGGTVIGSLIWGRLGDRIGRRASLLLASILFVTTSICGAMPGFSWNLLMCFLMGLGVGGMLPIAFVIMAETIPARHRGWAMVLVGGNAAAAYAATSGLAGWLIPHWSWRIMWLLGIPTGLLLVLLNRWIPESPRFLLATGRVEAAQAVMNRYGVVALSPAEADDDGRLLPELETAGGQKVSYRRLFQSPYLGSTLAIAFLAIGVGLVTYGFQQWIPSNLQHLGYSTENSAAVLRDSSLVAFPLNFVVAWLYGFWSGRRTLLLLTAATAVALLGFTFAGDGVVHHKTLLRLLLVIPIWGVSAIVAIIGAYSSEIYPTRIRATGSGFAAGASKAGGVLILGIVVYATIPSMGVTALIGAIPLGLAVLLFLRVGVETRQRRLEELEVAVSSA